MPTERDIIFKILEAYHHSQYLFGVANAAIAELNLDPNGRYANHTVHDFSPEETLRLLDRLKTWSERPGMIGRGRNMRDKGFTSDFFSAAITRYSANQQPQP